jgi:signal transduction histidine kinase
MYVTSILLIAPDITGSPVADSIRQHLDAEVQLVPNRRSAIAALRRNDYALILLEENLTLSDPEAVDHLYQAAGAALLLEINLALSNPERVVRQVRAAITRRAHDRAQARAAATESLHHELNSALAGLLLESELALREAGPAQQPKLRHVVELAAGLRDRLRA